MEAAAAEGESLVKNEVSALPLVVQQAYFKTAIAESADQFGYSISVNGDTIMVSAINEDSNQTTITNGYGQWGQLGW